VPFQTPVGPHYFPASPVVCTPGLAVGFLPITRAQGSSLTLSVTNRRLFRKLLYQVVPRGTCTFSLLSSDYNVLRAK